MNLADFIFLRLSPSTHSFDLFTLGSLVVNSPYQFPRANFYSIPPSGTDSGFLDPRELCELTQQAATTYSLDACDLMLMSVVS
jgi:hypothetical protein